LFIAKGFCQLFLLKMETTTKLIAVVLFFLKRFYSSIFVKVQASQVCIQIFLFTDYLFVFSQVWKLIQVTGFTKCFIAESGVNHGFFV